MKMPNKKVIRLIGSFFSIGCIVYIVYTVIRMDIDWSIIANKQSNIFEFLLLSVYSFVQHLLFAVAWWIMLCFTSGRKLSFRPVFGVYSKSNLAKYLPGNVMHFAGRNFLGSQLKISQADIAMATGLDLVMTVVSAVLMALILSAKYLIRTVQIVLTNRGYFITLMVLAVVGCVGIVVLIVAIKKSDRVRNYFHRFRKKDFLYACMKSAIVYFALFFILGKINLNIFTNILEVQMTTEDSLSLIGLTVISWTAGFVVPGSPGGIGIREAIMLLVMAPLFGEKEVAIAAVLLRVLNIIGDILIYVAGAIWTKKANGKEDSEWN